MTLVYSGSLASVHSHRPASPSRVSASCSTPLAHALLLAQVFKHRLASVLPTLDCPCRSDHVVIDRGSWKLPHLSIGRIRASVRTRAFLLSSCVPTRENKPRPEPGVCGYGESQAPLKVSCQGGRVFGFCVCCRDPGHCLFLVCSVAILATVFPLCLCALAALVSRKVSGYGWMLL